MTLRKKRIIFVLICCLCFFVFGYYLGESKRRYEYVFVKLPPWGEMKVNIEDPDFIDAIIEVESLKNPRAISPVGCIGLMQVNWKAWGRHLMKMGISKEDLFIPEKNIVAGKYILRQHHREAKGDLRKTLQGYSGGAKWYYERVMTAYYKNKSK